MGEKEPINGVVCGGMICDSHPNKENNHKVFNGAEFAPTYEHIKDVANELDGFAMLIYLKSMQADQSSIDQLWSLQVKANELVNMAHELVEHLAWD